MKITLKKYDNATLVDGLALAKAIEDLGYEAYLVGGCVRDMVRHQIGQIPVLDIHDIDIATSMPLKLLSKHFRTASNNGEKHGTILVFQNDKPFEVTHFRTDGEYKDGRHPEKVTLTESFEEDTARRDFTINALGLKWDGTVIDYHGGIDDIKNRIIRAVGVPYDRFQEDALRIIRGNRFAANFDYNVDSETLHAMSACAPLIKHVSNERIRDEILKINDYSANLADFIQHLCWAGAWDHIPAFVGINQYEFMTFLESDDNHITRDNVIPLIAYFGYESNLKLLVPTREETKLYRWLKQYQNAYNIEFPKDRYWTELVKFASNDYELALELDSDNKLPRAWVNQLPAARYIALNADDVKKKVSATVKKMGIPQGKEYGNQLAILLEAEYARMAAMFPTTIHVTQGNCDLVYHIETVKKL